MRPVATRKTVVQRLPIVPPRLGRVPLCNVFAALVPAQHHNLFFQLKWKLKLA